MVEDGIIGTDHSQFADLLDETKKEGADIEWLKEAPCQEEDLGGVGKRVASASWLPDEKIPCHNLGRLRKSSAFRDRGNGAHWRMPQGHRQAPALVCSQPRPRQHRQTNEGKLPLWAGAATLLVGRWRLRKTEQSDLGDCGGLRACPLSGYSWRNSTGRVGRGLAMLKRWTAEARDFPLMVSLSSAEGAEIIRLRVGE
ncbi:hypothetical protein NDU88_002823 [Pleurodeles waltl]|uniref:Uncharacterized protein n=1 Tax=Pleurodeles waltl TaxID=8319 RepID=A0AAV7NJP7_PLEWA|nr:hypothetical protein NDU88_002823 [Pleurodeles waltl]